MVGELRKPNEPFAKERLENGLTVYFYDHSRKLAGDRMEVRLLIEIPINIHPGHLEGLENGAQAYHDFVRQHGHTIFFRTQKIRNFIDQNEAPQILEQLKDDFLKTNLIYLSHPNFGANHVRKRYTEWVEEMELKTRMRKALEEAERL